MALLDRLRGRRDLLVPYFDFCRVLRANRESAVLRQLRSLRDEVQCADGAVGPDTDPADAWSVHIAAYDGGGQLAAGARLVQPPAGHPYPFQQQFPAIDDSTLPARAESAEVCWLVIRARYRRRAGDSLQGVAADFADHGDTAAILPALGRAGRRSHGPLLLLGIYRELLRHSRAHGIGYWYAVLDRPLARALDTMGFPFHPLGTGAQADGARLHLLDLSQCAARLRQQNPFLAAWLFDEPLGLVAKLRLLLQVLR